MPLFIELVLTYKDKSCKKSKLYNLGKMLKFPLKWKYPLKWKRSTISIRPLIILTNSTNKFLRNTF